MARVRNEEDFKKKREDLMVAAIGLIMQDGFDSFSLNGLLKLTATSKSSFFHYFESKQDLMDECVGYSTRSLRMNYEKILDLPNTDAKDKLIQFYRQASQTKYHYGSHELVKASQIYDQKNKAYFDLVTKASLNDFKTFLEQLIKEGVNEGVFKVEDMTGTILQIINITLGSNERISEYLLIGDSFDMIAEIIRSFERILNFLLGTEELTNLYLIDGKKLEL